MACPEDLSAFDFVAPQAIGSDVARQMKRSYRSSQQNKRAAYQQLCKKLQPPVDEVATEPEPSETLAAAPEGPLCPVCKECHIQRAGELRGRRWTLVTSIPENCHTADVIPVLNLATVAHYPLD